ncbi:hypothetical protein BH24ACT17_BH24ACT17_01370 [soil metagenome]|jgi:hypothetical protein
MTENLPLTLFIVVTTVIYLTNAIYLLRWARMPEDNDAKQRRYLLSAAALIVSSGCRTGMRRSVTAIGSISMGSR